jgi:hypothetical protein
MIANVDLKTLRDFAIEASKLTTELCHILGLLI